MSDSPTDGPGHPIVLIDGSGWLFRAYHALPPLTNSRGEATGAIYGMHNMLVRLLKEHAPKRIAVVFDAPGKTFRDELFESYKATRDATPEDLSAQFPPILELVAALGLPMLQVVGVEADDVIGTLAHRAGAAGSEVLIVTSDKDMAQLVDGRVNLLDTMKNRRLDPAGVEEKFGVRPEQIVDYLALIGDTSDNIPGVTLVGPKTAAKWLKEHGSLDAIVAKAAEFSGKTGENLRDSIARGQLALSRKLATIHCDVALPLTVDELSPAAPDTEALAALFKRYEFTRLLQELSGGAQTAAAKPAQAVTVADPSAAPIDSLLADTAQTSPPTRAEAVLDEAGFAAMLAALEAAELICVDSETDALDAMRAHLVGLSFAVETGHGWYLPLAHNYLGAPPQLPMTQTLARLKPLLEDPAKPKLGQHFKYDMNVLIRYGIEVQGLAYDTMLESYVLDATANRHDMDTLAAKYLGHTTIKFEDVAGKGKSQISFAQVSIETATAYAAEDADITLRLHGRLSPGLNEQASLKRVFETIEMPLVPVLAKMEREGVKVDAELLRRISAELALRMQEIEKQAFVEAGGEFNLGSPKQLQQIFYEQLKLPVLGRTPKGDPSTAEDVLEQLAAEHALPRLILDWRGISKLRSTYAETLPLQINPATGRIHTSYHQAVAATGRLSSTDPNLQNIPIRTAEGRRIREAFIGEPGCALLSIDYSQIELRLMAHISGDERLIEAFRQGLDVHQATAAEVFGLPLDQVGGEQRRAAKAINFGLIYGMSSFGLARQLGIARGEAQRYIETFFARYPGVRSYMDGTRETARESGYVETLFGRRLYLKDIRSKNAAMRAYSERIAINAPLQGTAADLIKLAMIDLAAWLPREAPQLRMTMQVHDELIFEGPTALLQEHAAAMSARMCAITALKVPLVADWGIGDNWNSAHELGGSVISSQSKPAGSTS